MIPANKVQAKLRLRLMIGLPALLALCMLISGWIIHPALYEWFFDSSIDMEVFRKVSLGSMLLMILLAFVGNLGAGILISRHINRLIAKLEASLRLENPSRPFIEATDEIDALGIVVDEVSTTLSRFVNDNYIIENLPEGLVTVDSALQITRMNSKGAELLGLQGIPAVGSSLTEFIPRTTVNKAFFDMVEAGAKSGRFPLRLVPLLLGDGRIHEYWVEIHPLKSWNAKGSKDCVSISIKDPASILAVKNQIQKIERLAAIGGVASSMAHEVRNPLGAIRTFTELLQEDLPQDDAKKLRYTGEILHQIDRLNQLIEDILAFSRDSIKTVKDVDVEELLSSVVQLVKAKFSDSPVVVEEAYQPGLPRLRGDPEKLSQAFVNMLINAFEACGDGGSVKVSAEGEPRVNEASCSVCIRIEDSGKGIPQEIMGKVLDPFFTTKPNGTGLGLAISHNILTAHGGTVQVTSEVGKGTAFQIVLPCGKQSPQGLVHADWSDTVHV